MEGTFAHDTARYRSRYPAEYALANKIDHPRSVYVKEDVIVSHLDIWIATLFDQANLDSTCQALEMAGSGDDEAESRAEATRRKIADCDHRLAQYRKTLDARVDAALVAAWMSEVQGERLRAEREPGAAVPEQQLTRDQIRSLVLSLKDISAQLRKADLRLKAQIYAELGVRVAYDPHQRVIRVSAGPCSTERVGGGT